MENKVPSAGNPALLKAFARIWRDDEPYLLRNRSLTSETFFVVRRLLQESA
jgi:hypothetical protein